MKEIGRQYRMWAISILLGWCVDLTPKDKSCATLFYVWIAAANAMKGIK